MIVIAWSVDRSAGKFEEQDSGTTDSDQVSLHPSLLFYPLARIMRLR